MAILVDTDVFSYLFKGDTRGDRYYSAIRAERAYISFMSVAELYRRATTQNWGERRRHTLDQVLRQYRVPPYDSELARLWARITVERSRAGRPIACGDCWIAATAVHYGLQLVTNNAKDFVGIDGLIIRDAH